MRKRSWLGHNVCACSFCFLLPNLNAEWSARQLGDELGGFEERLGKQVEEEAQQGHGRLVALDQRLHQELATLSEQMQARSWEAERAAGAMADRFAAVEGSCIELKAGIGWLQTDLQAERGEGRQAIERLGGELSKLENGAVEKKYQPAANSAPASGPSLKGDKGDKGDKGNTGDPGKDAELDGKLLAMLQELQREVGGLQRAVTDNSDGDLQVRFGLYIQVLSVVLSKIRDKHGH
jgi:hypothetical protein